MKGLPSKLIQINVGQTPQRCVQIPPKSLGNGHTLEQKKKRQPKEMPIAQKLNWLIQNQSVRGQYLLSPKLVP